MLAATHGSSICNDRSIKPTDDGRLIEVMEILDSRMIETRRDAGEFRYRTDKRRHFIVAIRLPSGYLLTIASSSSEAVRSK